MAIIIAINKPRSRGSDMSERWKIFLTIAFIGLAATPISMAAAKIDMPTWALVAGHLGAFVAGLICAELGRGDA